MSNTDLWAIAKWWSDHVLDARTAEETNLYLRLHGLVNMDSRVREIFEVLASRSGASGTEEYFKVRFRISQPADSVKPLGAGLSRILDPVEVIEFAESIARLLFDVATPNRLAPKQLEYASMALIDAAQFFESHTSSELAALQSARNSQQQAYAMANSEKLSRSWLTERALQLRQRAEQYREWAAEPQGTPAPWKRNAVAGPLRAFAIRWLDGLKLANGDTKAAAQYFTVFAVGDESCLSKDGLESQVVDALLEFIFGQGWKNGNEDGSSYQILEGPQFMLPSSDVALAAAANVANRPDQVRFCHVSAANLVSKLDAEQFRTLLRDCKF